MKELIKLLLFHHGCELKTTDCSSFVFLRTLCSSTFPEKNCTSARMLEQCICGRHCKGIRKSSED